MDSIVEVRSFSLHVPSPQGFHVPLRVSSSFHLTSAVNDLDIMYLYELPLDCFADPFELRYRNPLTSSASSEQSSLPTESHIHFANDWVDTESSTQQYEKLGGLGMIIGVRIHISSVPSSARNVEVNHTLPIHLRYNSNHIGVDEDSRLTHRFFRVSAPSLLASVNAGTYEHLSSGGGSVELRVPVGLMRHYSLVMWGTTIVVFMCTAAIATALLRR